MDPVLEEVIEERSDEIEKEDPNESDDKYTEQEIEQLKEQLKLFKTQAETMERVAKSLENLTSDQPLWKSLVKWVAGVAGAGTLFTLIGYYLTKALASGDDSGVGSGNTTSKSSIISQLSEFLQKVSDLVEALSDWLTTNQDETITLDNYAIPIADVVQSDLTAVETVSLLILSVVGYRLIMRMFYCMQAFEGVESVTNELAALMKSDDTTVPVPTAKQVSDVITSTGDTIAALITLTTNLETHLKNDADTYKPFQDLIDNVINSDKVLELQSALGVIENLPYE